MRVKLTRSAGATEDGTAISLGLRMSMRPSTLALGPKVTLSAESSRSPEMTASSVRLAPAIMAEPATGRLRVIVPAAARRLPRIGSEPVNEMTLAMAVTSRPAAPDRVTALPAA